MQTIRDSVAGATLAQKGKQMAGGVRFRDNVVAAFGCDSRERRRERFDARAHRARKCRIEDKEFNDAIHPYRVAIGVAKRLQRRGASQYRRPLADIGGTTHVLEVRHQVVILDIEQAGNVVYPLDHRTHFHQVIDQITRKGV